jgi:hypothetical protein
MATKRPDESVDAFVARANRETMADPYHQGYLAASNGEPMSSNHHTSNQKSTTWMLGYMDYALDSRGPRTPKKEQMLRNL